MYACPFFEIALISHMHLSLFAGPDASGVGGITFTDPRVCKSYLKECCPHEILQSTVRLLQKKG